MNFKDYIVKNYEKEFSEPAPKHLVQTLFSIGANHFTVEAFAGHFRLDTSSPLAVIDFLMNPNNSYEIGKFGNRIYEAKQTAAEKLFTSDRINSSSDEHYDYGEGKFTRRF
jgi:hypothetical protein